MENLTIIVFVVLSCVVTAALLTITFAVLLEKQKNEISHLKDANVCFVEKISRSEKWVSGLITALSKDVGNLSLTFEDTRHKFEKGWELASKMAADIEGWELASKMAADIDNDFISIDEEKTRKDWDEAADKATDRIVKYIADTIGNKDIEPERAEWLIRRYVRTVVGEITK